MQWSYTLIDQLIQHGVTYFCLSPGSRSTPLAIAIGDHPRAEHHLHFDERGMAYHALGVAKATGMPTAIVVTSGTAVANLLPAIIEASNDHIPLIILTADRPHELRNCGANQTCDQIKIFSSFVRLQIDLPPPSSELPDRFLATVLAQAVHRSRYDLPGPVHLNCPFREPLFDMEFVTPMPIAPVIYEPPSSTFSAATLEMWAARFQEISCGLILVGSLPHQEDLTPLVLFAKQMKWPILADILSPLRSSGLDDPIIRYFDPLLTTPLGQSLHPEIILHVGNRFVSATLTRWIKSLKDKTYLQITTHCCTQDPDHLVTHRITGSPSSFFQSLLPLIDSTPTSHWLDAWKLPSEKIVQTLRHTFAEQTTLTEPGLAHALSDQIPSSWGIFLSNSMPIRDANQFFFPPHPIGPIFGNRGVSGIDGNIGTAIGLAQGLQRPVCAILGDLAFLHDINSLAMLRKAQYPVILLVINNHGGAIFSFLPIAERKDLLEEFFIASHPYQFQPAAELFQIPYFKPHSMDAWNLLAADLVNNPCSAIIEWSTHRAENLHFHQELKHLFQMEVSHAMH